MCGAKSDVRFTRNSDRKSEFPQKVMSALPSKADMCSAKRHVCFGPKADILPWNAATTGHYLRPILLRSLGGSYMGTRSAQGTFVANRPL